MNSDDLWNMAIQFVIYFGSSAVIFYAARYHVSNEKKTNDILDTVYFAFVIMTSVGYGDLSPRSPLAFILASVFSLWGMYVFGLLLHMALDVLDDQQQDILRKNWSHNVASTARELIKKKAKIIGLSLLGIMVVETVILIPIENLDFIHALYCISITITSAGTEKCFSTELGRSLAIFWIIFGALFKNYVLFTFTEVYIDIKQRSIEQRMPTVAPIQPPEPKPPLPKPPLKEEEMLTGFGYGDHFPWIQPVEPKPPPKKPDKKKDDGGRVPILIQELINEGVLEHKDIEAFRAEFNKLGARGTNKLKLREIMAS
ncbi:hypothetical protein OSB04_004142 [Centaurea solstitialis]|uniref:Potassium channel domain-containing protein n=1 Tax=Centaurea solstitialis TaxID=347529 RepID=A0AA38WVV8_9ASTR|nr:hypothetical protein OSB04_004142 [Centaurea solstitialis]